MTLIRSKHLDEYYERGKRHALDGLLRDPFYASGSLGRYLRFAYDAGYAEGKRLCHQRPLRGHESDETTTDVHRQPRTQESQPEPSSPTNR